MRVALIEAEPAHAERIRRALAAPLADQPGGMRLETIATPQHLHAVQSRPGAGALAVDAMVIDWRLLSDAGGHLPALPRPSGLGRAPALVLLPQQVPEQDVARALALGAEDYAFKPICAPELRWRLGRLMAQRAAATLRFGAWRLDPGTRGVHIGATALDGPHNAVLTEAEFRLFSRLLEKVDRVVSRLHLIASSTLPSMSPDSRTLDTHIYRLRRKLPLDGSRGLRLQSVYCKGYQLSATATP